MEGKVARKRGYRWRIVRSPFGRGSLSLSPLAQSLLGIPLSILLLLPSLAATATAKSASIAQQPATPSPNANSPDQPQATARAKQLLQQAEQLTNQGTAESRQKAIAKYEQALVLWRQIGDRSQEASTLLSIGTLYYSLNENQKALDYYQQALAIRREQKNRAGEAIMLFSIGGAYANLGDNQSSLDAYNQALSLFQAENQPALAANTLASLGGIYLKLGETQKALDAYNQALAIHRTQKDRAGQADTLGSIGRVYTSLGEPQLALDAYNQALEIQKGAMNLAGQAETLSQIGILYTSLGQKQKALESLNQALQLQQAAQGNLSGPNLILNLSQQALILIGIAGTYSSSNDYQQGLNYYNQARSLLQKAGNRSAEAEVLNLMSYAYKEMLNKGGWGGKEGASQDLVPLLVKHEIVNLPSASTLGVLRQETNDRKSTPKAIAVLADPVFGTNDPRLQSSSGHVSGTPLDKSNVNSRALERSAITANVTFNRLPFTRQEAEQILALVPAAERMQAFDFAANRAIATSSQLQNYRIVHFATHGILNSTQPELSGVVLSLVDDLGKPQNGFLRLHDIFNLNLPAELVVLSACQTGLGEEVKGEGLVGLTRGFMYAGSPRVVVSLWSVDDEATSQLMARFYKKMLQDGLKPAAALRAAQLELWQQKQWQAPFYWAPFTLQGEWK